MCQWRVFWVGRLHHRPKMEVKSKYTRGFIKTVYKNVCIVFCKFEPPSALEPKWLRAFDNHDKQVTFALCEEMLRSDCDNFNVSTIQSDISSDATGLLPHLMMSPSTSIGAGHQGSLSRSFVLKPACVLSLSNISTQFFLLIPIAGMTIGRSFRFSVAFLEDL